MNKKLLKNLSPNSKELRLYKESLESLSSSQKEAVIGLLLGDASLHTQNSGKTYRIKFEWGDKNKPYLDHVYSLFDEWVISDPHKKTRLSPKGNVVVNWGFQTISHKVFTDLANLFINQKGKKFITKDLIKLHLTPMGLAYWFMDDGGKLDYNKNSKNKSVVLNTQSFTTTEVETMAQQLTEKFDLNCELRKNKGKDIIVIKNYPIFISLVDRYIIPEMKYKLPG